MKLLLQVTPRDGVQARSVKAKAKAMTIEVKAKTKDFGSEAKTKAKDLSFKAKAKAKAKAKGRHITLHCQEKENKILITGNYPKYCQLVPRLHAVSYFVAHCR